jgi:purine-binding chemotaxis protein CheW
MFSKTDSKTDKNALAGKHLTFKLGEESYGIEILNVQEIIQMMKITMVPKVPDYVTGVVNLRGKVIPIINIRIKFGLKKLPFTEKACIIVVQVGKPESLMTVGIIVDEVSEVANLKKEMIMDTPPLGASVDTRLIKAIARANDKVIMLLDMDRAFADSEFAVSGMKQAN